MSLPKIPSGWLSEIESLQKSEQYEKYLEIRNSRNVLRIYRENYLSLKKHFARFERIYLSDEFWSEENPAKRIIFKRKANQLVFNYLTSVGAVIDISRIFAKKELNEQSLNHYNELVKKRFVDCGSNSFVRQLRNFILHIDLLAVGVQVKFIPNPVSGHWIIAKSDLSKFDWEKEGKIFFDSQREQIDLLPLLEKYNQDFLFLQDYLYVLVLQKHYLYLKEFVDKNKAISDICTERDIWPGPPLRPSIIRYLYWVLNKASNLV